MSQRLLRPLALLSLAAAFACSGPRPLSQPPVAVTGAGGVRVEQASAAEASGGREIAVRLLDPAGLSAARPVAVLSEVEADGTRRELSRAPLAPEPWDRAPLARSRRASARFALAEPPSRPLEIALAPPR